jgi:hypothetical protein
MQGAAKDASSETRASARHAIPLLVIAGVGPVKLRVSSTGTSRSPFVASDWQSGSSAERQAAADDGGGADRDRRTENPRLQSHGRSERLFWDFGEPARRV